MRLSLIGAQYFRFDGKLVSEVRRQESAGKGLGAGDWGLMVVGLLFAILKWSFDFQLLTVNSPVLTLNPQLSILKCSLPTPDGKRIEFPQDHPIVLFAQASLREGEQHSLFLIKVRP